MFKDRQPYAGDLVDVESLIVEYPHIERKLTAEDQEKYIVEDFETLSVAVSQIIKSGYGGYMVNFARVSGWNPVVEGFKNSAALESMQTLF
ncbi:hypothetical protein [Alicyclobacillus fodiniaquatilis]|uniref:Uncharacterized protein n=1 Tax=Alicyclobacillus fodiniaquatilis TaxID=1661150 RepID=A0ABW4JJQ0_9BACL